MKKGIILLLIILPFPLFAQREITFNLGSGLFNFAGGAAVEKSSITIDNDKFYYPLFAPYSATPSMSFNLSSSFQRVDTSKFIYGASACFDYFNNVIYVDQIELDSFYNVSKITPGKVFSRIYEVSFSPFVGQRLKLHNFNLDIIGGVEFAFPLYAADYMRIVTEDGNHKSLTHKRELHAEIFDFRPNIKLACTHKKIGIFGQYLIGIKNYAPDNYLDQAYSRLIKFGMSYRILKE